MSQESQTVSRRTRRTRIPRHRPTLVTGTETPQPQTGELESTVEIPSSTTTENLVAEVQQSETPVEQPVKSPSRYRGFFSKVDKTQDEKAAQTTSSGKAKTTKPPSLFKVRHVIGLSVYLLIAQIMLPVERAFLISYGWEKTLFVIPGANFPVPTSFLFNIATLLVLLYLLVHFDLLPNSKGYAAEQAKRRAEAAKEAKKQNGPVVRQPQPTTRQGVKGEHDNLYQAYRSNQKRDKKR